MILGTEQPSSYAEPLITLCIRISFECSDGPGFGFNAEFE